MKDAYIDLPPHALRALHSGWIDYLTGLPEPIRDAMVGRVKGAEFPRFVLALFGRMILVTARIEDEDAYLGIALPVEGDYDWRLFEIRGFEAGVDAAWLVTAGVVDFEKNLDLLLDGES
jgi:hypothetical protein